MKQIYLLILFLVLSLNASAQNYKNDGKQYPFYCQIIGEWNAVGKIKPRRIIWEGVKGETKLTNEDGKVLDFNNIVEVMNFMSKRGWTFVDGEIYSTSWYYYVFMKMVTNDNEAKEGIYLESDFKN